MIGHFTLNGVRIEKDVPECWEKVSFRQYIDLIKAGDDFTKQVAILTGLDEAVLVKAQITNFAALREIIKFVYVEMVPVIPKVLLGAPIPSDLETGSIAQYVDVQEIAKKFVKDDNIGNLEHYPLIVATYCVKPYDFREAEKLVPAVFNAPCSEVMAIANFTLAKLIASKLNIQIPSLQAVTLPSKLKRVMRSWLYRLDFTIRYYSWKRKLPSSVQSYLNGQ